MHRDLQDERVGVLFVCLGNICRSPMAEAVFQRMVEQRNLEDYIICDSAGTGDYHIGSLPHPGTLRILEIAGIRTSHRARQISLTDFTAFHHILVMDRDNLRDTLMLANGPADVQLIMNYGTVLTGSDVPDPYFDGRFDTVYEMVSDACAGFLDRLELQIRATETVNEPANGCSRT